MIAILKRFLLGVATVPALCVTCGCSAPCNKLEADAVVPDTSAYSSVVLPSGAELLVFKAQRPDTTGKAVVIFPGGGYCHLAKEHEGKDIAAWMSANGVTSFVLNYRFPQGDPSVPNTDAREAFEYARGHADELGRYDRVGVMGSSAGGHLASTVATHTELANFQILLYPVVTMDTLTTHRGSHDFLLGQNPSAEAEALYSNEERVSKSTPPAFIALSLDDDVVPPIPNGVAYAESLTRHGVPVTMVCYPRGGHGWGWRNTFEFSSEWKAELSKFLFSAN